MKAIKTYTEFVNESSLNEQSMDINIFSLKFDNFYEFVNKYAKSMDGDTKKHLKEAIRHLDLAWENECDVHGAEFEQVKVKL